VYDYGDRFNVGRLLIDMVVSMLLVVVLQLLKFVFYVLSDSYFL
jgi:hypothetical protein